ncbi:hypothetical protein UCD39_24960 [Nitrospirillum sp. BR 11752]|uniref:hypothetical protein n=1 Tax=Nitrospirillum sp. BR 11752 TaxID=3104293 RepID=UPI002ECBD0D3|nr:hypothetical protein [Nitrospirillum sp. BR 11752]
MQVGVSGTFEFSEIFGGRLDFTTGCTLVIANGYSLIYAEITDLDIIAALNQAFDLGLAGHSLTVASAGFFTFSDQAGGSPGKVLSAAFPNAPVPASVANTATPVTNTTSLWLTIDLGSGNAGLFSSLVDMNVASGTAISLAATFTSNTKAATAIKSATYSISLDGKVQLFDIFTLQDIVLNYSVAASTRIAVSGTVALSLFGSDFTFKGDILSDSGVQAVTADITAEGKADLSSLFGGAFTNVSFSDLAFNLYYPYGKNKAAAQFMMRGTCDFAGLVFTGLLYMQGSTPVLGSVVFTQSASISTLFDQCIPNGSWPSSLIDLTLLAGCQVYYNNTSGPLTLTLSNDGTGPTVLPVPTPPGGGTGALVPPNPTQVTYAKGFNLAATFVLTLLDSIDVAGTVVVNGNGVTAAIDIDDPIDIYVLQITRQGDATKGPVLSISTGGSRGSMGFSGALLFFSEPFGVNATVTATRNARNNLRITTTLSPTRNYPPLLKTSDSLSFSYSADTGFQVTNWPAIQAVQDLIDFISVLTTMSAKKGSGCGAIADFIQGELLTQSYSMVPSFSTDDGGLRLHLDISYSLSFAGTQFATVKLKNAFVIPIPSNVTLDSSSPNYLWTVIIDAIGAAAESFVQALLDDPEATAKFLVLTAGQQAVNYAATLACLGLAGGGAEAGAEAGSAAAGSGLGTAGVSVAAVVAGVAGIFSGGGGSGGGGGGGGSTPPAAPTHLAIAIDGSLVTASWWLIGGAHSYRATLSDPSGVILADSGSLSYSTTSYTFANARPPKTLPALCTVAVTASNPAGTGPPVNTNVTYLNAPSGLTLTAAAPPAPTVEVTLGWQSVTGASGYIVDLSGGKMARLMAKGPSLPLSFAPTDPPGAYAVTVTALGSAQAIGSPPSAPLSLTRLATPSGLSLNAGSLAITAQWTGTGGGSYALYWTDPAGKTGVQSVAASPGTPQQGRIPLPSPVPTGRWSIAVQALPPVGSGTVVASAISPLQSVTVAAPQSAQQLAAACHAAGLAGVACGLRLIQAFPTLDAQALAIAMAAGGYEPAGTADGLHAAFPNITPNALAQALTAAYPPPPQTAAQLAARCHDDNLSGAACGLRLIQTFPTLDPQALAIAMAAGGYEPAGTADGLHAAFPNITPNALAQALTAAYPPPPQTAAQLAARCHDDNLSGAACGLRLIQAFSTLDPQALAIAMAVGGYEPAGTADGLHAAFPNITPNTLAQALVAAYP